MPLSVIELTTVCIQIGAVTKLPIDALACHSACTEIALICCEKECLPHGLHQWTLIWEVVATQASCNATSVQLHTLLRKELFGM